MEEKIMLQFIDSLIKKSGLKLKEDFLVEYKELLLERIEKKIWLVMVDELKDEAVRGFYERTMGSENIDELDDEKKKELVLFCQNNIPDFEKKVLRIMDDFATQFIRNIKLMK
ncbi:hypothetical protein A2Y83_04575 [Candidatus Falkowbacteria bacterium RBG_13_39_14]|uniref:Uncharacterized protein n=1 Tax=Candidatus Falkowbacteria bacterium RBG_13_39_14 TaxID=1797985 RepID=A0A1F5S756_9BACT|nr:MAG: hypothetical protein A2Y83_04575 [Candidatus Falkowbacteria bacterium RBG_13_39_14]